MLKNNRQLPELLAPAGSPRALEAAIDAGADAVYFGASAFNARIGAENFSGESMTEAFKKCHAYGVKAYLTLNTLALDRELSDYLKVAERAWRDGADALIVADIGGASVIKRYFPEIELHASTQLSGHNSEAGKLLSTMGFSRMVLARETSLSDIRSFVRNSPIEAEIFVHGALCVSHSGQCLFSSMVGGRSGNRGECAQPCRLPFSGKTQYPLSLKDVSLAEHIPQIIESGAASLKIEGRMKSAEYVRAVTGIYRTLLDEGRGATKQETEYLASVFSRGGFTDGYFTKNIGHSMLGIRSEEEKEATRGLAPFNGIKRTMPIDLFASFKAEEPAALTLKKGDREVTVYGDVPFKAINLPMTVETAEQSLSKLGGTPFHIDRQEILVDEGIMMPKGKLNALRREAVETLIGSPVREVEAKDYLCEKVDLKRTRANSARFYFADRITEKAREFFDRIYLPLDAFCEKANGVILPAVIFDSELDEVREKLKKAKEKGAKYALVGNLGHLVLAKEIGLVPVGDFRLNAFNRESAAAILELGFENLILSPELTLPQIRDIGAGSVIVYGRIPLMLLEKCVIKEIASCEACEMGKGCLIDRRKTVFPVLREGCHRNIVYNSLPTYMGDRQKELDCAGISDRHFIFSIESRGEIDRVIEATLGGTSLDGAVRRIKD